MVAFLISTPQTGADSILVSASMLGWPLAIFKVASAAITGLIGGWLANVRKRVDHSLPLGRTCEAPATSSGIRTAVHHGLLLIRSIWPISGSPPACRSRPLALALA